ncbi:hypothetical protein NYQ31_15800 [Curtobacterium flaccumfaciens]|uniref:hypothetical protein n=1 Tax=Curtobacterium TaxID=2034 RepID=UPI000DA8BC87|nr:MULTISPECIES: hypothetical protein [Curtobacterium]MCS6559862.1 hypothetical protein [Curtobacterium flaccumfaciens]PZE27037.1 hypothetical protein DEJ09_13055 [Curtobacterium sp. MCLR17_055]PZF37503.1 hypothetical protein DEJ07_15530 [Curtobacterium sp. MCLR17_053]PZF46584.1 hypothetical protein DEJ06_16115 [Curtobacterium sp. MCLR17_051]
MRTRHQRLIGLAERVLLHQPDVVPDSILFEWGDHRGRDWEQTLTVHYDVGGGSAGPHHRHHYFI